MKQTAVVIDDSPDMGPQLAGILRRLGVTVLAVCENIPQGLKALRTHRPTIATVDIQMPGGNGLDLVRQATAENLPIKLVVCSGTATRNTKAMATAAGAVAFIVKPFDHVLISRDLAKVLDG